MRPPHKLQLEAPKHFQSFTLHLTIYLEQVFTIFHYSLLLNGIIQSKKKKKLNSIINNFPKKKNILTIFFFNSHTTHIYKVPSPKLQAFPFFLLQETERKFVTETVKILSSEKFLPLMATPNQEAIDTFINITGATEAIAVQKLEVVFFFFPYNFVNCFTDEFFGINFVRYIEIYFY